MALSLGLLFDIVGELVIGHWSTVRANNNAVQARYGGPYRLFK